MRKHWQYLQYVIRHKWYVFMVGWLLRVPLRLLILHDLSKFSPAEWFPYVAYFYGGPYQYKAWQDTHGAAREAYLRGHIQTQEDIDKRFDAAWLHHIHSNKHHPQYWVLREDSGTVKTLQMPAVYVAEMVADWYGAGHALYNPDIPGWYEQNKDKITLHPYTRMQAEYYIRYIEGLRNRKAGEQERVEVK